MDLNALDIKSDERGLLVEAFHLPHDGQIFYLVIKPDETRGNHYHERKTEHFLVVNGSAEFMVKDRKTNNIMKVETNYSKPMVVTVAPNNTHSITATEEGAVIIVWVDEIFNKDDPDTIGEEV